MRLKAIKGSSVLNKKLDWCINKTGVGLQLNKRVVSKLLWSYIVLSFLLYFFFPLAVVSDNIQ